MCQGGLDPKYGLRDLEQGFKAARQSFAKTEENREQAGGFWAAARALFARFQGKEVTHG